ncbi:MAG: hypothetical protein IAF94_18600 [Pirellulaceae bacterium]|nr:hypothetical protein [Pirellulaceae bacterium]
MDANQWEITTSPEIWLMAAAFLIAIAMKFYEVGGKSGVAKYASWLFVAAAVILWVEFLWRTGAF